MTPIQESNKKFDTNKKRYFIVISRCGELKSSTHYANIESARDAAIDFAKENKGIEFLVCSVDSSYVDKNITSTHYY